MCIDNYGLHYFQSVQVLVDTLATMATIARGCGHQHIMDNTIECAMRLMNQSWQHILKVCCSLPPLAVLQTLYLYSKCFA